MQVFKDHLITRSAYISTQGKINHSLQHLGQHTPHGILANLVIRPDWQRRGVGSRLLDYGLELIDQRGVVCWTDASAQGIGLYQKYGWEEDRREQRLKRRLECEDWISVALSDMKENRDYLDQYGVDGFFKNSIAKLEEMDAAR